MAAAKPEAPPAGAAKDAAAAAAGAKDAAAAAPAATPAAGAGAKGIAAFIPLIAVVILAPALSWAVGQFVLLPQLKKELAVPIDPKTAVAAHAAETPAAEEPAAEGKEGKGKKGEPGAAPNSYEFTNVVVNLAGTMGTRYLKTTFQVQGSDKSLRGTFEAKKAQLLDVTLNVLSALSLPDLEEAGAKNLIREKLIAAYNQALGKKVVDQVYFSDFVVQ